MTMHPFTKTANRHHASLAARTHKTSFAKKRKGSIAFNTSLVTFLLFATLPSSCTSAALLIRGGNNDNGAHQTNQQIEHEYAIQSSLEGNDERHYRRRLQSNTTSKAGKSTKGGPLVTKMPTNRPTNQPSKAGKSIDKQPKSKSNKAKASKSVGMTPRPTTRQPTTNQPTNRPTTTQPTTRQPTNAPTSMPTTNQPSSSPTVSQPTSFPTRPPTTTPTSSPTTTPTSSPTSLTRSPTNNPTSAPTTITSTRLVPAPSCVDDNDFICLQNADFGQINPARYNIDFNLETQNLQSTNAYVDARDKWMEIITGDLRDVNSDDIDEVGDCENDEPQVVDDLYICSRDVDIDGVGGILGQANALWVRTDSGKVTSVTGFMQFDIPDIQRKIDEGEWEAIILHEMGHIIGIGPLWDNNDLLDDDNNYVGVNATSVWQNDWGCIDTPPVEMDGGGGTRLVHWDEECLQNEFMTGSIDSPPNPISRLSIATVEDMGYVVNYDAADPYDGSDTTCCTTGSISNNIPPPTTRPLSKAGMEAAVAYGQQVLAENQRPQGIQPGPDENGLTYIGDQVVMILYEEEGRIYEVVVTIDE